MQEQSISNKIIRNTVFNIIGRFWAILIAFFLTPFIIHHIGVERYGVWALVGVLTGYFGIFDFGIGYSFVKYISEFYAKKDYKQINEIVNTGFTFYSIFALIVITLSFLSINFILAIFKIPANQYQEVAFVFLLGIIIFGFSNALSPFFAIQAGLQRMDITNKISMAISIPAVIGTIFFLKNGYGLPGLMVNNAIVFLISSIVNLFVAFKLLPQLKTNPLLSSWRNFKTLFGFGFNNQVHKFAGIVHTQFDKFILAYFLQLNFVTFYTIACQVAQKLMELPMMLVIVIQPAASELDALMDKRRLIELYSRSMKYVILLAIPITFSALLFNRPFIGLWLGGGYEKTILTLQVFIIAYFINVLTGPGFCILNGIGKPQFAMRSSLLEMILNVALSLILVIKIGYFGVVLGSAAASLVSSFYLIFMFYEVNKISFRSSFYKLLLKPLMAGLLPFLLGLLVIRDFQFSWLTLAMAGAAYFLLFSAIIFISGYIDSYDKVLVGRYKKSIALKIRNAQVWKLNKYPGRS